MKHLKLLAGFIAIHACAAVNAEEPSAKSPEATEPLAQPVQQATAQSLAMPLSWYPREYLTPEELEGMRSYCTGRYRLPATSVTDMPSDATDEQKVQATADQKRIIAQAEKSDGDTQGNMILTGDVQVDYQGMRIYSDMAEWKQPNSGYFAGNVRLHTDGIALQGTRAELNTVFDEDGTASNTATISSAEYSLPSSHFRGTAEKIRLDKHKHIIMDDATFTSCEPGRNDWDIKSSELYIDREEGFGEAWHARLRIAEVPVFYFPYYTFPIDDRRKTGFLTPTLSILGTGEIDDARLPFYINIHPQADATVTPHYIKDRGVLWETQFRHLTSIFGAGELNYGYLGSDDTTKEKRESINYTQNGNINQYWKHSWVYNKVSDEDYVKDMNTSLAIDRSTHLPRRGTVSYDKSAVHFDVTAEEFQTIDEAIGEGSKPYRRLPQLNMSYKPTSFSGWSSQWSGQVTQFERDNDTLTGLTRLNGDRLVAEGLINYQWQWPFAFIKPQLSYQARYYQLRDVDDTLGEDFDRTPSVTTPKYSLDMGMFFERELNWFNNDYIQTLEPRLFYLQVPYRSQQHLPDFDTSVLTFNYNQLFRDYRFNGEDRVGDTKQVTAGLTTRFLDDTGDERFRASLGQIFYLEDQVVGLTTDATTSQPNNSSLVAEMDWKIGQYWRTYGMVEYDSYDDEFVQEQLNLEYNDRQNHIFNIGLRTNESQKIRQVKLGSFWSINDSWGVIATQTRDIWNYGKDESEPLDPVLDTLVGIEYQNCCWRTQVVYQEESKRVLNSDVTTDKDYRFLLRFELKGLGNFGSNLEQLLNRTIKGYSSRVYDNH